MTEITFETVLTAYRLLPWPDQKRLRELLLAETQPAKSPTGELSHVEQEISAQHNETTEPGLEAEQKANSIVGIRWADQEALSRAMKELLAALDIHGEPIGAENLQRMMEHSGLEKDELSRSLIEARDE